jgi:hypothetical protein
MNNSELTLDQLSEFAGGLSLPQSSQGGIYQAKMLAETAIKTAAASAVTGAMQTAAMQTAATGAPIQTVAATGSMQASTAATGAAAARVAAASAATGAMQLG